MENIEQVSWSSHLPGEDCSLQNFPHCSAVTKYQRDALSAKQLHAYL